jgi:ferric-dicitrate binding protein FerR (iron transport regulator)
MTLRRGGEVEALHVLERELESEQLRELDWEGAEGRLLARLRRDDEPARIPKRSYFWPVTGALAAAAGLALAVGSLARGGHHGHFDTAAPVAKRSASTAPVTVLDGDRVLLRADIDARDASVRVNHAGHASWSLERGGRARILERGATVTVALDAGALLAEVARSEKSESFAVQVEGTRVAVHGTVFRVERSAHRMLVDVREGTVSVKPTHARSATRGFLLVAPATGSFTLDGRSGVVRRRPASVSTPPPDSDGRLATQAAPLSQSSPQTSGLPDSPPMSAIEAGVSRMVALANRCFVEHTRRSGDIQIVAATTMTFDALPDGSVRGLGFAPPLSPVVYGCVQAGLGGIKFAASREGASVTRTLELSH